MDLFNFDLTSDLGVVDNNEINKNNNEIVGTPELKSVNYKDTLALLGNFISLDISVNATGWVKCVDGKLEHGVFGLESKDDLARKYEFKSFLVGLCGEHKYDYIIIEDIIGSCNFKTAKALILLNSLADELKYENVIHANEIVREGNKVWKKNLVALSSYVSKIRSENDKELIVNCMEKIGFEYSLKKGKSEGVEQDIFDAYGIACGVAYRLFIAKGSDKKIKLKTDILKGYNIKEFDSKASALDNLTKRGLLSFRVEESFVGKSKDIRYNFKKLVEKVGDNNVFLLTVETKKLGVVALEKGLNLDREISHIVVMRRDFNGRV